MEIKYLKVPLPVVLIALFYLLSSLLSGYDFIANSEEYKDKLYFWLELAFFITGMIIGLGLPLKNKIAYILFIVDTLLMFVVCGLILVLSLWMDMFQTELWFIFVIIFIFLFLILVYRYMRSANIRNLYFNNEI